MLNLSALFHSTTETQTFLGNITLSDSDRDSLSTARTLIRQTLRAQLPVLLQADQEVKKAVAPGFFTQGSWAYKTINAPAQDKQQADLDDGAYLPLRFVSGAKPSIASRAFFVAVDAIFYGLAQRMNWKLDKSKPTCSRLEISSRGHVDVPLYTIPDHEFATLEKRAVDHGYVTLSEAVSVRDQDSWTDLPTGTVLLAMRDGSWAESDPRPIRDWFLAQVNTHGEQLRRVVRYLKAWRDWTWPRGGPNSLLLMVALSRTFSAKERRDDLAFLEAVRSLPAELRNGILNPIQTSESLTENLGESGVKELIAKLEELIQYLDAAIMHSNDAAQSCAWLRNKLGPRFPANLNAVKDSSATAVVAAAAATAVPSPLVGRTKAG
jgi:cyclic GMP-AMP synthase